MLYIHYNQTKPNQTAFEYAIQGNNNVDVVCFDIKEIELGFEPTHIYVKVQSKDKKYIDKIELTESNGVLNWHLLAKTTRHKVVSVQLSFETNTQYFQTEMVELTLKPYINAEEEIENDYPMVLQDLQEQIDNLQGGGGGDVIIEKVWLTYDDRMSIIKDFIGVETGEGEPFVNDSTRIWVNFKTNVIGGKVIEEIKNGRFVIRLDYPIKKRNLKTGYGTVLYHQPLTKQGTGTRGYAFSFNSQNCELSQEKKKILKQSLIAIHEEDIKTNDYGEKYIHTRIRLFDYINMLCVFKNNNDIVVELNPITNEWIKNDTNGRFLFENYMHGVYPLGIPATCFDKDYSDKYFIGATKNKFYKAGGYAGLIDSTQQYPHNNIHKLSPAFSTYTALKTTAYYIEKIYSPYFVKATPVIKHYSRVVDKLVLSFENGEYMASTYLCNMSARPRCCVLNDNWETNEKAFIKKYPQADQQIKLYCKSIVVVGEGELDVKEMPIFRMLITRK